MAVEKVDLGGDVEAIDKLKEVRCVLGQFQLYVGTQVRIIEHEGAAEVTNSKAVVNGRLDIGFIRRSDAVTG